MDQARLEKDYDKMDLIGKAIQALEDDIKLHKVRLIYFTSSIVISLFAHLPTNSLNNIVFHHHHLFYLMH